jgi:hypothetical protein
MGTIPKIKKVQLKVNQNFEFALLGIVSSEPDYKLSLTLNRKLKISLKNVSPLLILDGTSEITFSRFSDNTTSPDLTYELVSNRSGKNILLKKLKNIDYILQVYDPDNETDTVKIKDKNLQYLIH